METPTSSLKVTCTFGHYTPTGPWTDVRTQPWADLAHLLTTHEVGIQEGTCIVPATFREGRRKKEQAERIDIVVLDSDAGFTLDQIRDAIADQGWAAAISSTHSHLTTRTKAKRGNWDKFLLSTTDLKRAPSDFLREKGYLPHVVEDARVAEEFVFFEHNPCPKFRIALPLLRPWLAASYDTQRAANTAWKERIEAIAATLSLNHDQPCTGTSRLFNLPRRPADGPPPETAVLEGEVSDLFSLPEAPSPVGAPAAKARSRGSKKKGRIAPDDDFTHIDPKTGEVLDMRSWARTHAPRFEIVTALKARKPDVFTGRVVDKSKQHLRCVNEGSHTQAGKDAATFVLNASEGTHRSFVYHCRHGHCTDRDRLLFLRQMLQEGWLQIADLTDDTFLIPKDQLRPRIQVIGGEIASIVDQAEQALIRANAGLYQRGPFVVRPGTMMVRVAKEREVPARQIFEVEDHALVPLAQHRPPICDLQSPQRCPVAIDAGHKRCIQGTLSELRCGQM
ncbi:hypothetical protein [Muricoccus radiodurans]|uniref:hypothetical protein n=1 Tax=Muricoccus radiodurans TaxID=2231721 RepID=UPI003CF6E757